MIYWSIIVIKIFIWGGKSSVLWLEKNNSTICDHKTDLPPQRTNFNTVVPILMFFFTFSLFKMYYFAPIASAFSDIKPYISQLEVTFPNNVTFATLYLKIYCHKFLTISNKTSCYIHKCIRISYNVSEVASKIIKIADCDRTIKASGSPAISPQLRLSLCVIYS